MQNHLSPMAKHASRSKKLPQLLEQFRLAGRILGGHLPGRPRPLLAGLKITRRCNLHCTVCPFWRQPSPDMDYPTVLHTLDQLQKSGARFLILEGGKPFLWHNGPYGLEEVVLAAQDHFFSVGVVTNGTLPLKSRADILWVSLDGLRDTHNHNRGPVFDRVMHHIDTSNHPNLYVNVTINRLNWREIPALVEFLVGRVVGVTIQFYYPYPNTKNLSLGKEERSQVLDNLIRMKRQGYPVADSVAALEALKENTWRCHPELLVNAEPDGAITQGCYLARRAEIACHYCGFAAHTELSLAFDLVPGAILTGRRIFGLSR